MFGLLTIKLLATRRRQIPRASPRVSDRVRLLVLTIALLFDAALGALTVRDIHTHGVTPVAVLAVMHRAWCS